MKNSPMQDISIAAIAAITAVAAIAVVPVVSFAQESAPVTRAQMKSEIVQLEKSGYSPAGSNIDYPSTLQAAEARVGQHESSVATTYGGKAGGATQAGSRLTAADRASSPYLDSNANSLYTGD